MKELGRFSPARMDTKPSHGMTADDVRALPLERRLPLLGSRPPWLSSALWASLMYEARLEKRAMRRRR